MTTTLTPREMQVLHEIGQGLTNREIGRALKISESAVVSTVTVILSKMGLQRRAQAAEHIMVTEGTGGVVRASSRRAGTRLPGTIGLRPLAG